MIVAVPPEITLSYHRAFQSYEQLASELVERDIIEFEVNDNLEYRPFLASLEPSPIRSISKAMSELKKMPKYVWAIFVFDKSSNREMWDDAKAIFLRDATQQTEFRLLYLQNKETCVYQLSPEKIYQRWNNLHDRVAITI